jgi:hypothetical protein
MKMCPKWRIHATWSIGKTPQTSSRAIKSLNKAYMKKLMEIAVKLKVDM